MDLISTQIQSLMETQSQVNITWPEMVQAPQPQIVMNTNNQMTDEMIARGAGRGIDKEGGNYQW